MRVLCYSIRTLKIAQERTMQNIKVANGTYKRLQLVNVLTCGAQVYRALFIKNDGYTEKRVCTVKNNKVLAWQS